MPLIRACDPPVVAARRAAPPVATRDVHRAQPGVRAERLRRGSRRPRHKTDRRPHRSCAQADGPRRVRGHSPWGEIYVDGRKRGISPPTKELRLPPGKHAIEVRNGAFPPHSETIEVNADEAVRIAAASDPDGPPRGISPPLFGGSSGAFVVPRAWGRFSDQPAAVTAPGREHRHEVRAVLGRSVDVVVEAGRVAGAARPSRRPP